MDQSHYLRLLEPAIELVAKKHEDYNNGADVHAYFPFGDKSYVQMLHIKTQRLVTLAASSGQPNFETRKDSVLDLVNYAVFYLDYLEHQAKMPAFGGTYAKPI